MIETFRGIWRFAGKEQRNIRRSVIACFFNAVFHMFEIAAIYYTILALLDGKTGPATAWQALGLLAVSILGSAVTKYFSQLQQTHAGYFMAANKRVAIGQRMKSVPMGYFNDNSLGELTGVCTTVLDNVETVAPMVLVTMLGGMLNALVFTVMILIFDWRIGLIVVAATAVYLFITSAMEQKSAALAPHRQKSEAKLVEAVLEYVQGMSVVKSFNLTGRGDRTLQEALEYNCRSNLNIEKMFTPYIMAQGIALQLGSVAMMLSAVWFYLSGTMILANALMVVIMSFLVFAQISSAGSGMSLLRIVSSCMAMLMRRTPCLSWQRPVGPARPGSTALPSTMFRSLMTSGLSCGMYPSPSRTEPPPPSWAPAAPGKPHCVISSPGSGMWRAAPSWWAVRM